MKWFRRNIKSGSRLALFALVVQFALSFAHFHSLGARAAPAIQTGLTQADHVDALGLAPSEAASQPQQLPSSPDTDEQPADACAICAVLALAGNALFATPPLLLLPQAVELLYLATDAEFAHLSSGRSAFQSRAPPAS
jgi:hypothetical protein